MNFDENTRFSVSSQLVASDVNDETVILDYQKGSYFSVEGVGSVIWAALQNGEKTINELCQSVMEEFDVEFTTCKADVELFLQELHSNGLLLIK